MSSVRKTPLQVALEEAGDRVLRAGRRASPIPALDIEQLVDGLVHEGATESPRDDFKELATHCVLAFAKLPETSDAALLREDAAGPLLRYVLWSLARYVTRTSKFGVRKGSAGNGDVADAFGIKENRGGATRLTSSAVLALTERFNTLVDREVLKGTPLVKAKRLAERRIFEQVHREPYVASEDTHKSRMKVLKRVIQS